MEKSNSYPAFVYSAGYKEYCETFEVELQSGEVYQYYDLPKEVYKEFTEAESKSDFYNDRIRRVYAFSRVS